MSREHAKGNGRASALVTVLFFLWGFLTAMNDILIPYLKKAFKLSHTTAMLVQLAFFLAYFVGSLAYYLISRGWGDPIRKIGYKNGILAGLVLSGIGALLFYPAAEMVSYGFFLAALFVLGLGFTLLQISANPYVTLLGPESSASSRLNLSQGFNSLGTTVAPLLGSILIYSLFSQYQSHDGNPCPSEIAAPDAVKIPYLLFAGFIFLVTLLFFLVKLPAVDQVEESGSSGSIFKHKHLIFGILAIFFYVGAEVSIGSNLISFFGLSHIRGLDDCQGSLYVAMYWGGLMTGRFMGAISLAEFGGGMGAQLKKVGLMLISGVFTLLLIFFGAKLKPGAQLEIAQMWPYALLTLGSMLGFLIGKGRAGTTLGLFALAAFSSVMVGVFAGGDWAFWAIIGVGLFNSIMWSNIFSLAIEGLGPEKSQGSSLLVMAIIGGALFPPAQGLLADATGVQFSFVLPAFAYLYLAWFGWKGHLSGRNNHIENS